MVACFMAVVSSAIVAGPRVARAETTGGGVALTVRVDQKTGRLVRRVTVPSQVVHSRVISPGAPAAANPSKAGGPAAISSIVEEVAGQYQVDPLLVHAIIHVESRYDQYAISPKGAEGLMQLIPATARRMGVRNSFNSRENIEGGVRYLRALQERFDDMRLVLAAYNAGEEAVARWKGIPPYAETQEYVYRVGRRYGDLRRLEKASAARVSAAPQSTPAEPSYRPVESYLDSEGRLHLRTR